MAWYWRPVRQVEDFEDARARLRELIGQSLKGGAGVEQREAIALLTDLLEEYEVRRALEEAVEVTGATLLAAQMARHDLGAYQFANVLGVSHARVSDVIRGERPLSRNLARVLLAHGVAPMRVLAALLAPKSSLSTPPKGFTLVELMVVVAIIALLASISTPTLLGYIQRAKIQDATNLVASCLQNARDQSMSRGEIVLVRVTSASGRPKIETFRAPLIETTSEVDAGGNEVARDRFASSCTEVQDPALAFTALNRVAVLNPSAAANDVELAERLDPNIRLVAMTDPDSPDLEPALSGSSTLDLCFAPDGRVVLASSGITPETRVFQGCAHTLAFVLSSKAETGPAPDPSAQLDPKLSSWLCPTPIFGTESSQQRRALTSGLSAMRDVAGVGVVTMSYHGAVRTK